MPSTTEEKTHKLNVCPFHKCNLILFEAQTNENVYIKCQIDQCPIFMHEDSAFYYMSNVCCKLHESYLKRKGILICGCKEAVSLRMSEKNQVAPTLYVETETVDSFSGQMWNYPRKIRKRKPNNSFGQSPWPGAPEGRVTSHMGSRWSLIPVTPASHGSNITYWHAFLTKRRLETSHRDEHNISKLFRWKTIKTRHERYGLELIFF